MGQLQQFLAVPADTAVAEGETAVLECKVEHRVGSVQWTKDGLTLGLITDTVTVHCESFQSQKTPQYICPLQNNSKVV